ncbi:MAG: hypothetical protein N3A62_08345 [Thermodesulfovibrionales bacterium]|nr:hypothetical protein [Thermodesulfovibrionales bacterium]
MKKTVLLLLLVVSIMLFYYLPDVLSHSNSAPVIDCMTCHQGELKPDIVSISGLPQTFIPNKVYNLTIQINSELIAQGEAQGGFALEATNGKIIISDNKNTQIINGVLTHTLQGSQKRRWNFKWQAPNDKVDANITVMVVASNGDYSSAGDEIGAQSYTIKAK